MVKGTSPSSLGGNQGSSSTETALQASEKTFKSYKKKAKCSKCGEIGKLIWQGVDRRGLATVKCLSCTKTTRGKYVITLVATVPASPCDITESMIKTPATNRPANTQLQATLVRKSKRMTGMNTTRAS